MELEKVFEQVAAEVSPKPDEAAREKALALSLVARAEQAVKGEDAVIYFVGSTARDTGLRGDRDIDLFIAFPRSREKEYIVARTMAASKLVAPIGWEMHYAEHPYLQGVVDGYKVELIPCFKAEPHAPLKSAVDRSPLHMDYLQKRLNERQKRDVRVMKQLLKANGIYGAEARIGGFSGLVCEYLILYYKGLENLLKEAAKWKPGAVVVDIENTLDEEKPLKFEGVPIVIIDAIDKNRNAAAAISPESFSKFVSLSNAAISKPSTELFFPKERKKIPSLSKRGTALFLVEFPVKEGIVEDTLYPQLERTLSSLCERIGKEGFEVVDSDAGAVGKKAFFVIELGSAERHGVRIVQGPPAWMEKDVAAFVRSHADCLRGPFIRGDRVVVEEERLPTGATEVIEEMIKRKGTIAVGPDVEQGMRRAVVAQAKSTEKAGEARGLVEKYLERKESWL